jgi:hypothetical protein
MEAVQALLKGIPLEKKKKMLVLDTSFRAWYSFGESHTHPGYFDKYNNLKHMADMHPFKQDPLCVSLDCFMSSDIECNCRNKKAI